MPPEEVAHVARPDLVMHVAACTGEKEGVSDDMILPVCAALCCTGNAAGLEELSCTDSRAGIHTSFAQGYE